MDSDDPALQPVIVLRVVIRSPDLDTFVSKYSRFVKDDRIFIFTKSSQPLGTRVRFTLELSDGQPLLHGEGTVTRIRPDGGDPGKPPGMELKFYPLDDASRRLVGRMLAERENQFKDETTDARTAVRDPKMPPPLTRDFDEAPPSLPPLQKTGTLPSLRDEHRPGQDESGAVTIAQAPPGERTAPDATAPPEPPELPAPRDRQSGSFATPTPLPAPIPAAPDEFNHSPPPTRLGKPAATHEGEGVFAAVGPAPPFAERFRTPVPGIPASASLPQTSTVPANPFSEVSDGAIEYFIEWSVEQSTAPKPKVAEAHFANVSMATPRAERRRSSRGPLLAGMAIGIFLGLPIGGTIVWFGRPLPPPVIVEKMPEAPAREPVAATDLAPPALAHRAPPDLATAAVAREAPRPKSEPKPPTSVAVAKPATPPATEPAAGKEEPTSTDEAKPTPKPEPKTQPKPAPKSATEESAELQVASHPSGAAVSVDGEARGKTPLTLSLPAGTHEIAVAKDRYAVATQSVEVPGKVDLTLKRPTATLHVESEPAGGDVVVEGKPRGKTPVDVTLEAFHHYDVQVMLLGTKPWHKRVNLKPPQTDVTAKLSVVHTP